MSQIYLRFWLDSGHNEKHSRVVVISFWVLTIYINNCYLRNDLHLDSNRQIRHIHDASCLFLILREYKRHFFWLFLCSSNKNQFFCNTNFTLNQKQHWLDIATQNLVFLFMMEVSYWTCVLFICPYPKFVKIHVVCVYCKEWRSVGLQNN